VAGGWQARGRRVAGAWQAGGRRVAGGWQARGRRVACALHLQHNFAVSVRQPRQNMVGHRNLMGGG
jgi:hypothetical protein